MFILLIFVHTALKSHAANFITIMCMLDRKQGTLAEPAFWRSQVKAQGSCGPFQHVTVRSPLLGSIENREGLGYQSLKSTH